MTTASALIPAKRTILDLAAAHGEVAVATNKKSCSDLRHQARGLGSRIDGDTMTHMEEVRPVAPGEVLRTIF